ncbi:hypothetical protein ACIF2S_16955 [Pseudomonas taetrolens]|uniref:hypothetical protein n=1 Tax=Pseudomonas taetrolens TaxID=47884 RepID=UPI0037C5605A
MMLLNILNNILPIKALTPPPNNKSEQASLKALKEQDELAARMTEMQSKAAQSKMRTDTNNAILSGFVDSANKASNTVSSSAKEIRY